MIRDVTFVISLVGFVLLGVGFPIFTRNKSPEFKRKWMPRTTALGVGDSVLLAFSIGVPLIVLLLIVLPSIALILWFSKDLTTICPRCGETISLGWSARRITFCPYCSANIDQVVREKHSGDR